MSKSYDEAKKQIECKVCGTVFNPTIERHYIAYERVEGVLLFGESNSFYDAYDCPYCGSQHIANKRKRVLETEVTDNE